MALISASSAAKTASATIAATTQTSPDSILISEFQYLFDTIQATAALGQTSLVFDLTTLSHVTDDITSIVSYLTTNGYHVTNVGNNYTITWGAVTTTGVVTTVNPTSPITAITPTSISVTSGIATSTTFTPTGGIAPYTYTCTATPNGLAFSTSTLSGTPVLSTGSYTVTVGVTDSLGQTFSQIVTILATAPAITGINPTSVQGQVGVAFSAAFIPTGGTGPYTFTTTGNTPNGLSFGSTSSVSSLSLSGTPITAGNDYNTLILSVVDSLGQTFSQLVSWTIAPSSAGLPSNLPGLLVNNGTGVLSWQPGTNSVGVLTNDGSGNLSWGTAVPGGTDGSGALYVGVSTSASNQSVVVGYGSNSGSASNAVVLGQFAGQQSGNNSVNIGYYTGTGATQGANTVSIGYNTGVTYQGTNSIAIGALAGFGSDNNTASYVLQNNYTNPSIDASGNINTGVYLWGLNVGSKIIITGAQAGTGSITGYTSGTTYYVIAWNAGTIQISTTPGGAHVNSTAGSLYGITITGAGNAQAANTIILNATGSIVEGVANQTNSFYVAPVRGVTSTGSWSNPTHQLPSGFYMVAYNPTTKEFIYWS